MRVFRKKTHIRSASSMLASILSIALLFPGSAQAIVVDDITSSATNHVASVIEDRYHLNQSSVQDQAENFNVSAQKGTSPQVSLFFNPTDPKPGESVEAQAFPNFFSNKSESLYFTWYLKRKDCGLNDSPSAERRAICDFNDDGKITVEDWKIEAMRTVVSNDFDSTCAFNQDITESERQSCADNMYNKNSASRINSSGTKGTDSDKDGYIASVGGDGRSTFAGDCSASDSSSSDSSDTSDDDFTPSATSGYALYVAGNTTDHTTTVTLSSSQTLYETATGFDSSSEFCIEEAGTNDCSGSGGNWRSASEYIGSSDQMTFSSSPDTWLRTVHPVSAIFETGTYHLYWRDSSVPAIASAKLIVTDGGSSGSTCSGESICYINDHETGYNYELPSCKHLFPKNYHINQSGSIVKDGGIGDSDGDFTIDEEHFWKTDPEDPSTSGNGTKDEANIAGLGASKFKWIYNVGDKVGVAVEGVSMFSTKYDNSSAMVMWALPKNICDVVGKSSRTETIKGYSVSIKTSTTDINDCLEDNLVDPTEGGQAENLDVSLSSNIENPSAKLIPSSGTLEETARTGNTLSVQASIGNSSESSEFLFYSWRVGASKDGTFNTRFDDQNVWEDITDKLRNNGNISVPNGNNLSALDIDLNLKSDDFSSYFKDGVAYFRFTANATENFSESASRSGRASKVIKLVINKSIAAYGITAEEAGDGSMLVRRQESQVLCNKTALQTAVCPVMQNQIVGLALLAPGEDIRNYAWTLNGSPLVCDRRVSSECANEKQGSVNFFPATGAPGSTYAVSVIANNPETGKSFTVTRAFQVVDPDFDVISNDTTVVSPKYLGKYVNLDGSETEDVSKTSFESFPGATASLSIVFRPETLGNILSTIGQDENDPNRIYWTVNGETLAQNTDTISFPLNGVEGATYSLLVEGAYSQPRAVRKALHDIWGVSAFNSDTVSVSKDIQIYLGFAEPLEDAGKKPNTFFASLISAIPTSVLFSIRLLFTIGLLLFGIALVFSFAPEEAKIDNER